MKIAAASAFLIFAAALGLPCAAFAQEEASAPAAEPGEVMSAEDLEALSGGTGVTAIAITEQTLNAINTGNSVVGQNVTSGQLTIGAHAFSGYSGVGNFVFNTGHNNNLQSSMNVSVVLAPAPEPAGP